MHFPIKTISQLRQNPSYDYMFIGPVPRDEVSIQPCEDRQFALLECTIYIEQLIRKFGIPADWCIYFIFENYHDSGTYYEASISFYIGDDESIEYAFAVEAGDTKWDGISIRQLCDRGRQLCINHLQCTP